MTKPNNQHARSLLESLQALLWNERTVRTFRTILALFLDPQRTTTLQNVRGISASTASRFFSCEHTTDEVLWQRLNRWQTEQLYAQLPRRGRRGDMVFKLDLTCIEKTGKRIPFAWTYNRSYGIQLVVLHACWGGLRFPLGYRVYPKNSPKSATDLATELLEHYRHLLDPSRIVVMADAGFGHNAFIRDCLAMGYRRLLVGVRCDRTLSDGRNLNELTKRGERVSVKDLPDITLWASWCDVKRDEGKRRFYLLSTFAAGGAYLARRYRKRWFIESFFKSVKYDFGLREARLRTPGGIRLWVFFACLAYSLASLKQHRAAEHLPLPEAAVKVCDEVLEDVRLFQLMMDCERFSLGRRRRVKVVVV